MSSESTVITRYRPVAITRAGQFWAKQYGDFEITPAMLAEMVRNFDARTYGQDIHIDVSHRPEDGSAGKITRMWIDGDTLMAAVEWTPYGLMAITERGYQYLSAEYDENYRDNETRRYHGAVLKGAGLTIRPVIKRMERVELSELNLLSAGIARTGCADRTARALTAQYLDIAEMLPDSDARGELAVHFMRLAESAPKPPPGPVPMSDRQISDMVQRIHAARHAVERERKDVFFQRQQQIDAWITEDERAREFVTPRVAYQLRQLAEKRLSIEMDETAFKRLMADLSVESARLAFRVCNHRLSHDWPPNPRYRDSW